MHSEHEAGVGKVLCVDDPPLQLIPTRSTLAFFVFLSAGSVTEAEESISNARLFLPAFFASVSDGGRSLTKVHEVCCIIIQFFFQMANDTSKNSQ